MIRDRTSMKGKITARVISLDEPGLEKMAALYAEYPKDVVPNRKRDPDYLRERDAIYAEHGFRKRRQTWGWAVFFAMVACAVRLRFHEAFEVLWYEMGVTHNIVTNQGDALIADQMSETPTQTKVDNTNGHITVGTGWTGTTPKTNEAVNTPTGNPEVMDATYPKQKGAFGAANDNVTQYRVLFEAGDLNQTGIDEAGLGNHATEATGDNLAYGQISPSVDVATSDTLQVDWEITYVGA